MRSGPNRGTEELLHQGTTVEIDSFDGLRLRGRWWQTPARRAVVAIAHGFGEHGGTYSRLAHTLTQRLDLDVVAFDFRGHGRSDGPRGFVQHYDDLLGDLRSVVAWLEREFSGLPLFLLGHSNGGQVTLRLALEHPPSITGYILSNPALKIALPIPRLTLALGRFLLHFLPRFTLKGKVQTELLTHDPVRRQQLARDPLRHSRMSAPLFFGMVAGGPMLHQEAPAIDQPILVLLSGEDPVIDPNFTRQVFDRFSSTDKTLLYYPRMLHEPFNEVGYEQVCDDLVRWLSPRL